MNIYFIMYSYFFIIHVVPDPIVKVNAPDSQIVGEPLTLESSITTVRGITSRVDIVWSSDGLELKRIEGIESSLTKNNSVIYMDSYNISLLSTDDEGRTYQCAVIINQVLAIIVNSSITLDVTGEFYISIFNIII